MAESTAIADTILRSAIEGSYPDSEDVASADLTSSHRHLPTIIASLQAAQDSVKEEIRTISREHGTEVDSWIAQARQLHADIEASKEQADEILRLDAEEKTLSQAVSDAETHQRFLIDEIRFSESLASMLGKLQLIGTTLTQIEDTIERGELDHAVGMLSSAEDALERLRGPGFDEIIVVGLMKEKTKMLRKTLLERVEAAWSALVSVDKDDAGGSLTIRKSVEVSSSVSVESETVIATLDTLGLLKDKIDHFHQQIDRIFIIPRLESQEGRIPTVTAGDNTLRISAQGDNDLRAVRLFSDLRLMIDFLGSHLPATVMERLSRILVPNLTSRLISTKLSSSVPPSLDDLPAFEELLEETKRFEEGLDKNWIRERALSEWVERAPKVWLAKRREWSLDAARNILIRGIVGVEKVEKSETETVQVEEADDWNVSWNDEEEEVVPNEPSKIEPKQEQKPEPEKSAQIQPAGFLVDDDDDGADGWGLDEDLGLDDEEPTKEQQPVPQPKPEEEEQKPVHQPKPEEEATLDDDEMDWSAWGDHIEDEETEETPSKEETSSKHISNTAKRPSISQAAPPPKKSTTTKDVTLTEVYTVTSTPRALLELISTLLAEANQLETNPKYRSSPIASAANGLRAVPTLILSVFRALAPLYYKSKMYLYNDCTYLTEQLPVEVSEKDKSQIMVFAKRQYSHEMETQRAIFCDYLDGAQGFASCTETLQRQECDRAINATIQHLRSLYAEWQSVLSKSALLQSMGSLLNTVVTKLVNDIEDLSDISEPESVALAKYCAEIAGLEQEMFPGRTPDSLPVTPIYCPGWIKFRYLEQILGSSMKDIMILVREGCLREFEKEELVELVRALFADSEFRQSCIEDIRRA